MSASISRRGFLVRAGLALAAARPSLAAADRFDAVVAADRKDGAAAYPSIAAAIEAAPASASRPFRILVGRGMWREKLVVAKPQIHLVGEDRTASTIVFGAAAGHRSANGEPYGTRGCTTLTVRASGFGAHNLTISNDFDYVGNLLKPEGDPTRLNDPQGVALMLDEGSDRALIENVDLVGHQDTLFIDAGLSHFRRCLIKGSVDFVFGAGRALLEACEIKSRFRPGKPRQGYIAAPSTPEHQPFGLVFHACRLTKEAEVPPATVVLGRPWRPARSFVDGRYGDPDAAGHAAFIRCWMDDHISADGWDAMRYLAKSGERVFLTPEEARLFEFDSRGPGARAGTGRRTLSRTQALGYSAENVLDGWTP